MMKLVLVCVLAAIVQAELRINAVPSLNVEDPYSPGKTKPAKMMPGGGKMMPGGGKMMPGGGKMMPGGGKMMPGGGKMMPGGGKMMPGGGKMMPGGGKMMPSATGSMGGTTGSHTLDQAGINLIKGFEGWESCYYNDVAGHGTIGYGHLVVAGDPYHQGSCITQQQGEQLLASDAATFVACVNGMGVNLNQNQFDALVSFTYNLGCGALSSIKPLIQAGNYAAVCPKMKQYIHAGGQVVQGLVNRRAAECDLFGS